MPTVTHTPFVILPKWILFNDILKHTSILVYAYLAHRANTEHQAWPGIRTVGRELGMSTRTVQNGIDELETIGAIRVDRKDGRVNRYHVRIDPVAVSTTPVAESTTPTVVEITTKQEPSSNKNQLQDRGIARRDEWWDTLTNLLGKPAPSQTKLQGRLVARVKADGHPPQEILVRAERLAAAWGPEKLTLASLEKHWERMGVPLAGVTKQQMVDSQRQRELAEAMRGLE